MIWMRNNDNSFPVRTLFWRPEIILFDMRTHSSIEENGVDPDRNASKGTASDQSPRSLLIVFFIGVPLQELNNNLKKNK